MLRVIFLFLLFVSSVKADEPPPPQVVVLTTVKEGKLTHGVMSVGTFTPYNDVTLKAEIPGKVEAIHFKEGESAKFNQKLLTIHSKEQEAKVKKAEASLKASKNIFGRKQQLFEKAFISSQELEAAESKVKNDEADLALAKEDLAKTQIIAPFEGVLSMRKVCKGTYVKPGDELVRIQDLDPIRLIFQLPQKEISMLKVGDSLTASTDVYPNNLFDGKIEAIEPSVNEKTRTVTVYAIFANKDGLLIPGLYAQVHPISSKGQKTDSLVVPEEALVIRQDGTFVFKNVSDKAVLTKITLGARTGDKAEVLSGLQKDDVIILSGQEKIKDGDGIKGAAAQ